MIWQQQKKYVRFLKEFPHYQVEKFNGTKGNCIMKPDNIGVLNEATRTYVFKQVKDEYINRSIVPEFIEGLLIGLDGKMVDFYDSHFPVQNDEDEMTITERFEIRLLKARSDTDVRIAKMYYEAAQLDRLSIKATVMRMFKK